MAPASVRSAGRLEQHPEQTRVDVREAAIRVRIGGKHDAFDPGLVREKALDEIVDRLRRVGPGAGQRIAEMIVLHGT